MVSRLFDIGTSALTAAQTELTVSGDNIAGVRSGASRQRVIHANNQATATGSGYVGNGTHVVTIERIVDSFVNGKLDEAHSRHGANESFQKRMGQINDLVASRDTGVTATLTKFLDATRALSNTAADSNVRSDFIATARTLTSQLNDLQQNIDLIRGNVNTEIQRTVDDINTLITTIADLNHQITQATAGGLGHQPNALLDARDQAISSLHKLTGIRTLNNQDGSIGIQLSSGHTLVYGKYAQPLHTMESALDPQRLSIGTSDSIGTKTEISDRNFTDGKLGGLVQFRSEALETVQHQLGTLSAGIANEYNHQHRLGIDAAGNPGGDLFTLGEPTVLPHARNTSGTTLTATLDRDGGYDGNDYEIRVSGGDYIVTRLSDQKVIYQDPAQPAKLAGIDLAFTGTPANDESFVVRGSRAAVQGLSFQIDNPNQFAGAKAVRADRGANNLGDASIEVTVTSRPPPGFLPLDVTQVNGNLIATRDLLINGTTYPAGTPLPQGRELSFNGLDIKLGADIKNGDAFTIKANDGAQSDNSNAALLAELQTRKVLDKDTGAGTTFGESFSILIGKIGDLTQRSNNELKTTEMTRNLLEKKRASISGTDRDEEITQIYVMQNYYQASSNILRAGMTVFDTLLSISR